MICESAGTTDKGVGGIGRRTRAGVNHYRVEVDGHWADGFVLRQVWITHGRQDDRPAWGFWRRQTSALGQMQLLASAAVDGIGAYFDWIDDSDAADRALSVGVGCCNS